MLAGVGPELCEQFERTGMHDGIGNENVFRAHAVLGTSTGATLRAARDWLAQDKG